MASRYDPLLDTNRYSSFVAQNTIEFKEIADNDKPEAAKEPTKVLTRKEPLKEPSQSDSLAETNTDNIGDITKKFALLKKKDRLKARAMSQAPSIDAYIRAKYTKYSRKFKNKMTLKQKIHFRNLTDPWYRRFLSIKNPNMTTHRLFEYQAIRRSYKVNSTPSKDLNSRVKFLYRRWESRQLPKLSYNSELLREITLHSVAVNEKRGNQNESRLPPLTVPAVDVLAIMYLLIKIEFNLNILAVRIRISN